MAGFSQHKEVALIGSLKILSKSKPLSNFSSALAKALLERERTLAHYTTHSTQTDGERREGDYKRDTNASFVSPNQIRAKNIEPS